MNILFVVPYIPNLIRVRPYNLIKYLAKEGHRITLVALWSDEKEREGLKELKQYTHKIYSSLLPKTRSYYNAISALPTNKPLQSVYCWNPETARQIASLISQSGESQHFDIAHVEHLRGAHYGLLINSLGENLRKAGLSRLPVVWDSVDSISLLFRQAAALSKSMFGRWLTRFELKRTERHEARLLKQFDHVLVTSKSDKKALLELPSLDKFSGDDISVLPNGVDLEYFSNGGDYDRDLSTLVVSGKMSYHANITMTLHLVNNIMPKVWDKRPDVRVCIVGKDPARELLALTSNPAITVTGTVDDIRPYLKRGTIAVVPITYGAGIQNKVLEAMACGTPVVSTPLAVSAVNVRHGKDLLVAEGPDDFARDVLCLLEDSNLRKRIGEAGRRFVKENHEWSGIATRLEDIYHGAISKAGGQS
jgi:polysaccharide biosynthesis protein PslH